jgi:hypothetical protein
MCWHMSWTLRRIHVCHMRRRIHVLAHELDPEEDTCVSYEEEDTCVGT